MTDTTQYPSIQLILGDAKTGTEIYKWSKGSVAALAAELHSLLTSNAVNAQLAAEWEAKHHALRTQIAKMGREMASVVDERDALKAKSPPPPRVLREVKGVTYRDERFYHRKSRYVRVVDLMAHFPSTFTDADHAAIYALKDDPYLPAETVGDVLSAALNRAYMAGRSDNTLHDWEGIDELTNTTAARLRAAVAAERGGAE